MYSIVQRFAIGLPKINEIKDNTAALVAPSRCKTPSQTRGGKSILDVLSVQIRLFADSARTRQENYPEDCLQAIFSGGAVFVVPS